jgi:outer membrane protein assembly factor BamB
VGGRAYIDGWTKDGRNHVYCLDADTGKVIWEQAYAEAEAVSGPGPRATPCVDGDRLYTFSQHGTLHCWAARDGKPVWQTTFNAGEPQWNLSGSPVVAGDLVLVHAGSAGCAAKKATGAKAWESGGGAGYATPVVVPGPAGDVLVLKTQGGAVARAVATGETLWTYGGLGSDIESMDALLYGPRHVLLGGKGGWALLEMKPKGVAEVWKHDPRSHPTHKNFNMRFSNPVLVGDYFYAWHEYTRLRCVDARTGAVAWEREDKDFYEGAMIAGADGRVIAVTLSGALAVFLAKPAGFDPEGRAIWNGKLGGICRALSLAAGRLYVRDEGGTLTCLRIGEGRAAEGRKR